MVRLAVAEAKEEGFPTDVEAKEAYFLQMVTEGETLSADRKYPRQKRRSFFGEINTPIQPLALSTPP